ncbi:ABC transporter permease [Halobaculum sp. EA56]|uniref:ABC transporter permease n=1 Tax=Halobaculum sp. EA56 TaxID=3421648 RepID=UPI003EBA0625
MSLTTVTTEQTERARTLLGQLVETRKGKIGFGVVAAIVVLAVLAPVIAPHDPIEQSLVDRLVAPSLEHPFGTDAYGRDILSRILYGFRYSLLIGVVSVAIGTVIGVALGMVGGYYGGRVDTVVGRLIDVMLAFPFLLFALFIVAVLGQSLMNVMIAVGIATSPRFARLARGDTLSVKEEPFVTAAKSMGRPNTKVMVEHLLPNIITPVLVMGSLNMGRAIIISAALSFLGLGVQPPTPTLGGILSDGRAFMELAPWVSIFPGLAITVAVLGFNLLGDAIRDVLDPKLQQGGGFT